MKQAISYTIIFLGIQLLIGGLVTGVLKLTGHGQLLASPYTNIATLVLFSLTTIIVFIARRWAVASKSYLVSRPWGVLFWSVMAALGVAAPSIFVHLEVTIFTKSCNPLFKWYLFNYNFF